MAVGNLVKQLQDIMRKDAGINGDAQRIKKGIFKNPEEYNEAVKDLENELYNVG